MHIYNHLLWKKHADIGTYDLGCTYMKNSITFKISPLFLHKHFGSIASLTNVLYLGKTQFWGDFFRICKTINNQREPEKPLFNYSDQLFLKNASNDHTNLTQKIHWPCRASWNLNSKIHWPTLTLPSADFHLTRYPLNFIKFLKEVGLFLIDILIRINILKVIQPCNYV